MIPSASNSVSFGCEGSGCDAPRDLKAEILDLVHTWCLWKYPGKACNAAWNGDGMYGTNNPRAWEGPPQWSLPALRVTTGMTQPAVIEETPLWVNSTLGSMTCKYSDSALKSACKVKTSVSTLTEDSMNTGDFMYVYLTGAREHIDGGVHTGL